MYMAKTRQVVSEQAEADGESDGSTGDEVTVASAVQRVLIKQSPYLDAFHEHLPVRLTIDSGATGNMMKASCATQLGVTITGSTQSAHQADGSSLLKVLGEIRTHFQRDGHNLYFEGLVVEDLDSDILAGIPFMEKNDVSIRPAKHQICLGDDVYRYGTYHTSTDRHAVRRAHVLRAPAKSTVWPGEYIELDLPPDLCDVDGELAAEPHIDALCDQAGTHQWPAPTLLRGVSGKIRVPNLTNVPQLVQKSHQLCRVRATYVPPISDATVLADPPRPVSTTRSSLSSDLVALDPDNIMPSDVKDKFRALHREFDEVFDPQFKGYNGAVGPFQAKVNMGPVQPPQRKGRVPQYSRGQLQELQAQFDMLEGMSVFKKPEDVDVSVEYVNPSFLIKKPGGGFRLVTAFSDVGRYSKPQPSLMPDVDSTLRLIAQWKYIIATDLTKAFYQIPLSRDSWKYCGVVTPFKGRCGLNLSATKTTIAPVQTSILGWVWRQGTIQASPHRVSALAACPPPKTVTGLRSFIGAYKVLARVLKDCATMLAPFDDVVAGRDSKDVIHWSDELLCAFRYAQKALSSTHAITLPRPADQLWIVTDGAVREPGLGATLYITCKDTVKVAGYFSAKLRKNQTSWLPCEIEALSIAAAVKHFAPYIIQSSQKTCVLTDSKPCVQAFEKLCRGEFSASPRVTSFLSTASRFQVLIRHVAGAAILPSDFASRNAPECESPTCQVCTFIHTTADSVVRQVTAEGVMRGAQKLPFTNRSAWLALQSECSDLRRTCAHLRQVAGSTFAADVFRRDRQFILVVRECVTSVTLSSLIEDERRETLRDALLHLCLGLCPLDGPFAVIRTDPAPGFAALAGDEVLAKHRLVIEVGNAKNINKNPVAEKAVQELQGEILRLEPNCRAVTPLLLSVATARLNSRVRSRGLSAREMLLQRDQFSNRQLPVNDQELIMKQHLQRVTNHPYSVRSKTPSGRVAVPPTIRPGDLVYLYGDRNKSKARDRYLVTGVDGAWCNIRKFTGTQLRRTSYRVRLGDCYKVEGPPADSDPLRDCHASDVDPDDSLLCGPDIPPAISEPPPAQCLPCDDIGLAGGAVPPSGPGGDSPSSRELSPALGATPRRSGRRRQLPRRLEDFELY
ncbi:hypothetical protein AAFF_G00017630 [Aldrovandia affinis]|uniref:Reverse transcriptase/retrotransposon-derived protein RNase H-like domain-containing protein n=1 Tax=Aldrovandia affinis TaxID=143900 RepID=A0AAD7S651_9TELE|nr:hypothetical protein AAFF_G00017630 [Aldrovandia affinis]